LVWATGLFTCVFYFLACITPAIFVDDGIPRSDLDFRDGSPFGITLLLLGWTRKDGVVPWSANFFLVLGLLALLVRFYRVTFVLGGVASALGLTTWWLWGYDRMLIGYYFWQSSLLLLTVGAGWEAWRQVQFRKSEQGGEEVY